MSVKIINEICSKNDMLLFKHVRLTGENTQFFTPKSFPLQVGMVVKENSSEINKHKHAKDPGKINFTAEILIILKGKLAYSVWDFNFPDKKLSQGVAVAGDILILGRVAHSFKSMTKVKLIEVKQGPFLAKIGNI